MFHFLTKSPMFSVILSRLLFYWDRLDGMLRATLRSGMHESDSRFIEIHTRVSVARVENGPPKWGGLNFKDKNQNPSRGSGCMLLQQFSTLTECFWGLLTVVLRILLYCVRHTENIHIWNMRGLSPPSLKVHGGLSPLCPSPALPIFPLMCWYAAETGWLFEM